jgi:hypothetical protein
VKRRIISSMRAIRYIVLLLALAQGCWLALDGARALVVGDYFTPPSGQLGPWTYIVASLGLAPRSLLMKSLYFGCGLFWLAAFLMFALRVSFARVLLIVAAIATLWYIPLGTVSSLLVIILLVWARRPSESQSFI